MIKTFMEHWKSTILVNQIMTLLTPEAHTLIKIHKRAYQWTHPLLDEVVIDGCSLLNPQAHAFGFFKTNVYAELVAKIKAIMPVDHGHNIVKWHLSMNPSIF